MNSPRRNRQRPQRHVRNGICPVNHRGRIRVKGGIGRILAKDDPIGKLTSNRGITVEGENGRVRVLQDDTAVQVVVGGNVTGRIGDEGAVRSVAETEDVAPVWIGLLGAEEEDVDSVAVKGIAGIEVVAVESGACICDD